jgi:hypothetical protein
MAFSSAPEKDTYSTKKVALLSTVSYDKADGGITSGMINVLPYKNKTPEGAEEVYGMTRYGMSTSAVLTGTEGNPNANIYCVGAYVWEKTAGTTYYFVAVRYNATELRIYTGTNGTSWTLVNTLTDLGSSNVCRFTEFISGSAVKSLVLLTGVQGVVYTSNAAGTVISDADFPTPHVPFPVFLNGRLYVAKASTGDIYNSALDNPATWTAGDFISSEVYPDDIQALVKIDNYILAIGQSGSEYFYDAANATGSPLARYEGASLPFGTNMPNTIAYTKDTVTLVASDAAGEMTMKTIEGLKFADVPSDFLMDIINQMTAGGGYLNVIVPSAQFRGFYFRQRGNLFYVLSLFGGLASANNQIEDSTAPPTFCYSFATQIWTRLGTSNNSNRTDYVLRAWPVFFTAQSTTSSNVTWVAGHSLGAVVFGKFLSANTGFDTYNQYGSTITGYFLNRIALPEIDFGTMNLKYFYRIGVSSFNNEDSTANIEAGYKPKISWSFNRPEAFSYTYSRQTLGVNDTANYEFPFITQLGAGRKLWVMVDVYGNNEFSHIEIDVNKGQQ